MGSSEVAAWVQAIGSVGAIIAAIYISSRQFRQATQLQERQFRIERKRRYETLTALVAAALDDFEETLRELRGASPQQWFNDNSTSELMEEFYQAFKQISPLEMPSPIAVRALVTLRDRLKTAAWNANTALEQHAYGDADHYKACVDAMEHNLNEVREELVKLQQELAKVDC